MKFQTSRLFPRFIAVLALLCALTPVTSLAVVLPVQSDTALVPGSDKTYGKDTTLSIGGGGHTLLVKFEDFSHWLPANLAVSDVAKATFQVYVHTWNKTLGTLAVTAIRDDWEESAVTGLTPLTRGTGYPASETVDGAGRWYAVDITDLFKDWLANGGARSFELAASEGLEVHIDSKENTTTSHAPFLDVTLISGSGIQGEKGDQGPV